MKFSLIVNEKNFPLCSSSRLERPRDECPLDTPTLPELLRFVDETFKFWENYGGLSLLIKENKFFRFIYFNAYTQVSVFQLVFQAP